MHTRRVPTSATYSTVVSRATMLRYCSQQGYNAILSIQRLTSGRGCQAGAGRPGKFVVWALYLPDPTYVLA